MQLTYAPEEPRLFLLWERPEDPQIDPHAGIKMAQGLVSPSSISVVLLHIVVLHSNSFFVVLPPPLLANSL